MVYKGADATERQGASFVLSENDHPSGYLFHRPKKLSPGSSNLIKLKLTTVRKAVKYNYATCTTVAPYL